MHARLRNQMNRLFHSSVEFTQDYEQGNLFVASRVVGRGEFWWNERGPDDPVLWESKIELGEKFFNEIIRHPVPLDVNTLTALKAFFPGPRSLPVDGLPDLQRKASAAVVLAVALPAVRGRSVEGKRQRDGSEIPQVLPTGTHENQARLAGAEVLDGQGHPDPQPFGTFHSSPFNWWNKPTRLLESKKIGGDCIFTQLTWASLKRAVTLVVGLALLTVSPVVLAQSSSDAGSETTQPPRANADVTAPTSAEAENTPRWKFDVGVSISPLFGAFFDESSCCTPLGGWVTVGSGRFRLQVDYVRNVQRWGGFTDSYEHLGGQEIVVERALGGTQVEQVGGVTAYWRLSKNPRWTPHLLLGIRLADRANRPCRAEGHPVIETPPVPMQRFRVDFTGTRPCADEPANIRFGIFPQVGVGVDRSIGSRWFLRAQVRLFEVRFGAGIRF